MDEKNKTSDKSTETPESDSDLHAPQVIDSIEAAKPATEQEFQKVEREMNAFERSTLKWARVAVLMSGLAAVFVGLQWIAMHGQLKQMSTSNSILKLDQRAWLGVSAINGIPKVGQPYAIDVSIKNTGHTPAKSVSPSVFMRVIKPGDSLNFDFGSQPDTREFIPPDVVHIATPSVTKSGVVLRADTAKMFENSTWQVFVFGKVWYEDIFNRPHWMRFCYFWDPKYQSYTAYKKYNDEDEDDAN
jgi:hypothetical protein